MAKQVPPITLPWIGFKFEMSTYVRRLESEGFRVERARDASSALTLVQQRKYPLLIMQDWFPTGDLDIPPGLDCSYPTNVSVHFLKTLRQLQNYRDKPIIIPHYLESKDVERLKIDDRIFPFNALESGCSDHFIAQVRSHLR